MQVRPREPVVDQSSFAAPLLASSRGETVGVAGRLAPPTRPDPHATSRANSSLPLLFSPFSSAQRFFESFEMCVYFLEQKPARSHARLDEISLNPSAIFGFLNEILGTAKHIFWADRVPSTLVNSHCSYTKNRVSYRCSNLRQDMQYEVRLHLSLSCLP